MGLGDAFVLALALGQPLAERLGVLAGNIDDRMIRRPAGNAAGRGAVRPDSLTKQLVVADAGFPDRDHQILADRHEAHADAVFPRPAENHALALLQGEAFLEICSPSPTLMSIGQRLVALQHQTAAASRPVSHSESPAARWWIPPSAVGIARVHIHLDSRRIAGDGDLARRRSAGRPRGTAATRRWRARSLRPGFSNDALAAAASPRDPRSEIPP